ncbi:MAG: LamG domain-containing protein [Fibrobacteria bacterium]|nr:LamG domain-containing protein [Fibrobacteria bacterium]
MNHNRYNNCFRLLLSSWFLLIAFTSCSENANIAGTTVGTENVLTATLITEDNQPAANARVSFYASGFLPIPGENDTPLQEALSNKNGILNAELDTGIQYHMEIILGSDDSSKVFWKDSIILGEHSSAENKLTYTLVETGHLQGIASFPTRPNEKVYAGFRGTGRVVECQSLQSFILRNIPTGMRSVTLFRINTETGEELLIKDLPGVTILSGETSYIDTIVFSDLNRDLAGYWPFDEASGDSVFDISGNNHNGFIYGPLRADGVSGGALNFDPADSYVEISEPEDNSLDYGKDADFTLSVWFNTSNPTPRPGGSDQRFITKQEINGNMYTLAMDTDGRINFELRSKEAGNTLLRNKSLANMADGKWHHALGVRKGNETIIYVDGVKENTTTATNASLENDSNLVLGALDKDHSNFYGLMDEVRIYNRALENFEVKTLFNLFKD